MNTTSNINNDALALRAKNNLQRLEEDNPALANIVRNIINQPAKDAYWTANNIDTLVKQIRKPGETVTDEELARSKRRVLETAFDLEFSGAERRTVLAAIKQGLRTLNT